MTAKVTNIPAATLFAILGSEPGEPAVTPRELQVASTDAQKFSQRNLVLAEAAIAGSHFRVAFRKPGATEWTRVAMSDQTLLKTMVLKEIESRQYSLRDYMANLTRSFILGVFGE